MPVQFYLTNSRVHWEKVSDSPFDNIVHWYSISTTGQPKKKRFLLFFFFLASLDWIKLNDTQPKKMKERRKKQRNENIHLGWVSGDFISLRCAYSAAYQFLVSWSAFSNKKRCERFMVPIRWMDLVFALRK